MPPEKAAALWQRAAQLQAEAAKRLDERSRALTSAALSGTDPQNFSLDEVRAAAVEAGIAPEFVALAVTEMKADPAGAISPALEDTATRFLGTAERSLELSRVVDCAPSEVYTAMQRVLPAHPWSLTLRDISGDALAGGVMVFDVPALVWTFSSHVTPLAYNAECVDVQQLLMTLRPVTTNEGRPGTEILVRTGLQRSVRRNFTAARWVTGVTASIGGIFGAALGTGAGLGGAVIALPVLALAGALGAGGAVGYRAIYRHYLAKFRGDVTQMLDSVAVNAKTGGSFAPPIEKGARLSPDAPSFDIDKPAGR